MSLNKSYLRALRRNHEPSRERTYSILLSLIALFVASFLPLISGAESPSPTPVVQAKSQNTTQQVYAMPGTGVEQLAEGAQRALGQLMSEGPCPCDPKQTLLQCIQGQSCPAATSLAAFGVKKYQEGLGTDQVAEAIINKFVEEFTPPVEFDLSKTPYKGDDKALITIVEFADFECPHCALMADMMKDLIKRRPGLVKVYFKQFPLPFHKLAPLASRATLAAHKQGSFWPMHDLIFSQQGKLSETSFVEFAEQLGLNMMLFRGDFSSDEVVKQVEAEHAEGVKAGLQGTPTLYFNGKMYRGEQTIEAIIAHVDALKTKLISTQTKSK